MSEEAPAPKRPLPSWLPTALLGGAVVLLVALYNLNLTGERALGAVVAAALLFGPMSLAADEIRKRAGERARLILIVGGVLWLVAAGFPLLRILWPGTTLAQASVRKGTPAVLELPGDGPWDLEVGGEFRTEGSSDTAAAFSLEITGDAGSKASVDGRFTRTATRTRGRRGAGVAVSSRTESHNRVLGLVGHRLTVSVVGSSDELKEDLHVIFRRPPWPTLPFYVLLGALAVVGLILDVRLVSEHRRTHFTAAIAFSGVFAWQWSEVAESHALVRPAIGAGITALLIGGLGGMFLSWVARAIFVKDLAKK